MEIYNIRSIQVGLVVVLKWRHLADSLIVAPPANGLFKTAPWSENRHFSERFVARLAFSSVMDCISNVNGVLQYTRITALCNTSVIFMAVQKGPNMLVSDFEIIIMKPFPAALMLSVSPFGFYGDILEFVYTTPSCGAMVSARSRKHAISIETIDHRR